ncbi:MAG: HXXEE domain-containing protein [Acidobacteriota bacterium]
MTLAETRPAKAIYLLSWLIPLTYLIHIAEEYWGGEGYPTYIYRLRGVHLSPTKFLVAQAIGFMLVTIGIVLARQFNFPSMMLVILSTTVMVNGVTHTFNALMTLSYNPGLLSSVLIWIPMGIFVLVRFKREMNSQRYRTAIAIGVGINVVIGVITMRGGRVM